jgi:predicted transposase YdaD
MMPKAAIPRTPCDGPAPFAPAPTPWACHRRGSEPAGTLPVVASDKLFYWLFQQRAERLQPLVASLLPQMEGYVFSAPVLKEREYRLDGLFLPPADQPEWPTLILEAQMGPDPEFLLRLNAETGRLLQQQQRQGRPIRQWQVVVICPSSELNFGDPTPVEEFVERRVVWIELLSERLPQAAPPLQRALGMLLLPEAQLPACSALIRAEAAGTSLGAEIDDVIAAILVSRFSGRTVQEICAMGGITVDDFSSSVAYREIFGLGRQEGRQAEAAALTLRLLQRRCGSLNPSQQARIQALPLSSLEALADALLDFQGPEDLKVWLSGHAS